MFNSLAEFCIELKSNQPLEQIRVEIETALNIGFDNINHNYPDNSDVFQATHLGLTISLHYFPNEKRFLLGGETESCVFENTINEHSTFVQLNEYILSVIHYHCPDRHWIVANYDE